MMLGYFPYAITFGHLHTCAMQDEGGVKIIRGGSLAGSGDDYTIQKDYLEMLHKWSAFVLLTV